MSVGTGAAIAIGTVAASSVVGGVIASNAAGNAAKSQNEAAKAALQQQIAERSKAISLAQSTSAMSPGEMSSIKSILDTRSSALSASMATINKQQTQLDAMDPQVKAAGGDLYDLLTGHASSVLAPMQQNIDQQRTQLQGQLASQLGPGWATSSAGIMAMTQFNMQSANTLQTAQQGAITNMASTYGSLAGMQAQGQNAVSTQTGEAFGRAMTADESVLQANQFVTNRQTNAVIGAMGATPIGFAGPVATAGAEDVATKGIGNTIAATAQSLGGTVGSVIAKGSGPGLSYLPSENVPQIPNLNPGFGLQTTSTFGSTFAPK